MDKTPERRFFGRRFGRPLLKSRQAALDSLLPALSIPQQLLNEKGDVDPRTLFASSLHGSSVQSTDSKMDHTHKACDDDLPNEIWFEIGFGTGEHLSGLMRENPKIGYIGAEPFVNGMAAFLKDISEDFALRSSLQGLSMQSSSGEMDCTNKSCNDGLRDCNVRVVMDDAMFVANSLAENTLDGIYVLNPDPWHKVRHHKRRIINQENLDCFARILKPGGQLIMSTDVPYLAEWMVTQACMHPAFEWSAMRAKDWQDVPEGWIHTAYETKRAKGADKMVYLLFRRSHG